MTFTIGTHELSAPVVLALAPDAAEVLAALRVGVTRTSDELAARTGLALDQVLVTLTRLELAGLARKSFTGFRRVRGR